jgi:hypothetical protein
LEQVVLDQTPVLALYYLVLHTIRVVGRGILEMDHQDAESTFLESLRLRGGNHGSPDLVREPVNLVDTLPFHAAAGASGVEIYLELGKVHITHLLAKEISET